MLRGINPVLTGGLLKVLSDMGHGDTIIVADGNYSSTADATQRPVIWLPGYDTLYVVQAILHVMPLDEVDGPSAHYIVETKDEKNLERRHWIQFSSYVGHWAKEMGKPIEEVMAKLPRSEFHELARTAYAIVATNDTTHYACFALRKGALPEPQPVSVG